MDQERYQILEKVGEGGVGEIHKGYDTQLKRTVAIKRLLSLEDDNTDDGKEDVELLIHEATTLSSFQHPNIVTVYDIGKDEQGYFVVMELIKGETIDQAITRGALNIKDFSGIVIQSLEGLIAAHAIGLIHRDIKPGNIMLTWTASGRFQVKILDFGLAKFSHKPSVQTMDQNNSILGSIYFMAPEQFEHKPLDNRVDLYSLGCIFYYSLTGQYPFNGESAAQIMSAHLQEKVKHISKLRPDLPEYISNWVMRLMSKDPDSRPSNAKEALMLFLNKTSGIKTDELNAESETPENNHQTLDTKPNLIAKKSPNSSPIKSNRSKLITSKNLLDKNRPTLLTSNVNISATNLENPYKKKLENKNNNKKTYIIISVAVVILIILAIFLLK